MKIFLLAFTITFLLILPLASAELYLYIKDYHVKGMMEHIYYENNTPITNAQYFYTLKTDLSYYYLNNIPVYGAENSFNLFFVSPSICYFIDYNGTQSIMKEMRVGMNYLYSSEKIIMPILPTATIRYNVKCIGKTPDKFGVVKTGSSWISSPSDEDISLIKIQKQKTPFLSKYDYLDYKVESGADFILDNSDENFYILRAQNVNPRKTADVTINFERKFDLDSFISDNIISSVIFIIIGALIEASLRPIKRIIATIRRKSPEKTKLPQ